MFSSLTGRMNVRNALLLIALVAAANCSYAADSVVPILRGHTAWVQAVTFSPDGTKALSASLGDGVRYWDIDAKKELAHFNAHPVANLYAAFDVKFTPDGTSAVSSGQDKAVEIWNLKKLSSERRLVGHPWGVNAVSVSPRGDVILSAGQAGTAILWNRASGKVACNLIGNDSMYAIGSIVFDNDGKTAISASQDRSVRTWDLTTCKQMSSVYDKAYKGGPVAMAPHRNLAVSRAIDRKTLVLWELNTGRELSQMMGHTSEVNAIQFSPDGTRVISGGNDKRLIEWNVSNGKVVKEYAVPTEIISSAVSRTGASALIGGKDGVIYWAVLE